jgi:multidrug resistance efflux pump
MSKPAPTVQSGQILASLSESSLAQNIILARADLANARKALEDLRESRVIIYQTEQAIQNAEKAVLEAERALVRFDEERVQR